MILLLLLKLYELQYYYETFALDLLEKKIFIFPLIFNGWTITKTNAHVLIYNITFENNINNGFDIVKINIRSTNIFL